MVDAESLETSVAAALELDEREIGRLITLKQLRKTIEKALTQDLAEDYRLVPWHSPLDTARQRASRHFGKRAAIAEAEVLLTSLVRG